MKGLYLFLTFKDKEVFNCNINSFNSLKGIFQEVCPNNHLGTFQREIFFGTVTWVSELKLLVENEISELISSAGPPTHSQREGQPKWRK